MNVSDLWIIEKAGGLRLKLKRITLGSPVCKHLRSKQRVDYSKFVTTKNRKGWKTTKKTKIMRQRFISVKQMSTQTELEIGARKF